MEEKAIAADWRICQLNTIRLFECSPRIKTIRIESVGSFRIFALLKVVQFVRDLRSRRLSVIY